MTANQKISLSGTELKHLKDRNDLSIEEITLKLLRGVYSIRYTDSA